MLGKASNEMLSKAEQGIQSKLPANMQAALQKVVAAGLTIMYSPQLQQQRQAMIQKSGDPAQEAGQGAARLVSNLYQQSNKTMPPDVIVPAATIFALEFLDLLAKVGKVQITPDLIAQTTQNVADAVLPLIKGPGFEQGVTQDKLAQALAMAKQKQQGSSGIINQAQGA